MVVGVLQFELLIHEAHSLKDKRRVVRSLKDRLHRDHLVSVAEVAALDTLNLAVLAVACVGRDGAHVGQVLDRIVARVRRGTDYELGDTSRHILHSIDDVDDHVPDPDPADDQALRDELLRYARDAGPQPPP